MLLLVFYVTFIVFLSFITLLNGTEGS